jgi:2-keto-3-deoxy-L-rhamnonate aldolase RhmA
MASEIANPTNAARDRMRSGEVALGMILRLARSGEIARIAKATGHDFLFIDGQHALYSLETINSIVLAALGCGIALFVRTRGFQDADTGRLLDAGVAGIIVPDVNNAEEARAAVDACKFAPVGKLLVTLLLPA